MALNSLGPGKSSYLRLVHGGGNGGGGDSELEIRIKRLEEELGEVRSDIKATRNDLQYIRGKVDNMPNTLQLLGFGLALFAAAGVLRFFAG